MKKILLSAFILMVGIAPAFCANWMNVGDNLQIDLEHIDQVYFTDKTTDTFYTFWLKKMNDKSPLFTKMEEIYNKKIQNTLEKYTVNCTNPALMINAIFTKDMQGKTIEGKIMDESELVWIEIPANSKAEVLYYTVCFANVN